MNWSAFHDLVQNPLWWVLPAILIGSWLVNHRDPTKFDDKPKKSDDTKKAEPPATEDKQE